MRSLLPGSKSNGDVKFVQVRDIPGPRLPRIPSETIRKKMEELDRSCTFPEVKLYGGYVLLVDPHQDGFPPLLENYLNWAAMNFLQVSRVAAREVEGGVPREKQYALQARQSVIHRELVNTTTALDAQLGRLGEDEEGGGWLAEIARNLDNPDPDEDENYDEDEDPLPPEGEDEPF